MNWDTYIAFGDSITIGSGTYLGYPELVGNILDSYLSTQCSVINHSVNGFKAIDLARDIDKHFLSLRERKPNICTILIGTNDVQEKTELSDFKIALDQIILKVKLLTTSEHVIIFAIPEFHDGVMHPYSMAMNETISLFNVEIRRSAIRHNIRMLKLDHSQEDFSDGVHLNRKGIETFALQIAKYILKDKGINIS